MTAGRKFFFTCCSILLLLPSLYAQKTRSQLEKEKDQQLNKIKEVEKIITETSSKKKNSIGELNALTQQVKVQETLIKVTQSEISYLNREIDDNVEFIETLETDLLNLKKEYANMLYSAQKADNSVSRLTFLFSASTFDQFLMRLQYMHQYGEARKQQAKQIMVFQDFLTEEVNAIKEKKTHKGVLLDEELKEKDQLAGLRKKQTAMVRSLEKEETSLRKNLTTTRAAIATLDKEIENVIREEIERERAKKTTSSASSVLSSSFQNNKSKFNWPVAGFIAQPFGPQRHPITKTQFINKGLDFQTKADEKVHAIFDGEVSNVRFIPFSGWAVLIKHGEYYTVYSGLKEYSIKVGDKVTTGQDIGVVNQNLEGSDGLHFEIWKGITPIDPQVWLKHL